MTRQRQLLAWATVLFVLVGLGFVALGHSGPASDIDRFRPGIDTAKYVWAYQCLIEPATCPNWHNAVIFLIGDVVGNIIVFVPLGAALFIALGERKSRSPLIDFWAATASGMIVSILFEVVQIYLPGRIVSVEDVITNTFGTALGAGIVWIATIRINQAKNPASAAAGT